MIWLFLAGMPWTSVWEYPSSRTLVSTICLQFGEISVSAFRVIPSFLAAAGLRCVVSYALCVLFMNIPGQLTENSATRAEGLRDGWNE